TVKLRDAQFRDRSRSRTLTEAVQTDRIIYPVARGLLRDLRDQHPGPIRLIGVGLTNLRESGEQEQASLVEVAPPLEDERERRLAATIDRIRVKHGKVIGPGTVMPDPAGSSGGRRHGPRPRGDSA